MPGSFVVIAGRDEWNAAQLDAETARREAFTRRVAAYNKAVKEAQRRKDKVLPPPLLCASCAKPLHVAMRGIETPAGRLKCPKCRVGVKA